MRGGINLYAYVGNDPVNWVDPEGKNTIAVGAGIGGSIAGPAGAIVGGVIGAGIGLWIIHEMSSDADLQKEIEQEANRREYKNICNEPPPPGLTGCELAKWKLNRAKRCKAAREENTKRWWGGEDNRHNPQLHTDNDRAIEKAQALVDRLCKCE